MSNRQPTRTFASRSRGGGRRGGRGGGGRGRGRHSYYRHETDSVVIEEFGTYSAKDTVTVAVEGCCHGELDAIYQRLQRHEAASKQKIDLLICCGDMQTLRNMADFHSFAVPPKYRALGSFYRYYNGEKVAPIPTVFVGGNHEASQSLHELYYGGWVAPNIYYMGAAGVIQFGGLRIGGISGIYKSHDYTKPRFEMAPYDRSTMRSVYHTRNVDAYRMKSLGAPIDGQTTMPLNIMVSHDWPLGIEQFGDTNQLLRCKPFFRKEVEENSLGSLPNKEILDVLKPNWWFAAHLHVKFHAMVRHTEDGPTKVGKKKAKKHAQELVPSQVRQRSKTVDKHENDDLSSDASAGSASNGTTQFLSPETSAKLCQDSPDLTDLMTQFLSLDKCLPRRHYLSILHVPTSETQVKDKVVSYDPHWLTILRKTHSLSTAKNGSREQDIRLPQELCSVTPQEIQQTEEQIRKNNNNSLIIDPAGFEQTVPPHLGPSQPLPRPLPPPLPAMGNPQTDRLLAWLGLEHSENLTIPYCGFPPAVFDVTSRAANSQPDENEIDLDEDENEIHLESDSDEKGEDVGNKKPRLNSV